VHVVCKSSGRDLMRVDDLRALSLCDGLTDEQLADLIGGGSEIPVGPGVELFREGEHADFWWVLVDGSIDLSRHIGQERTVVGRMMPGSPEMRAARSKPEAVARRQ
jgi:CRP-like cAMP-binding protein